MNKLMEKNAVRHAVIWIVLYVLMVNVGDMISEKVGTISSVTSVFVILFSILLLNYLKKNHWMDKFGLKKITKEDFEKTLLYLPLVFIALIQFTNGIDRSISNETILISCLLMIGVGFIEELIFRGFLMDAIWKKSGKVRAVLISGIAFGLGHIVNLFRGYGYVEQLSQILLAGGIGIVLALLVIITKNLVPGILFHIVFNISGTISNQSDNKQVPYILIAILVVCVGYSLYLIKFMKEMKINTIENQISV